MKKLSMAIIAAIIVFASFGASAQARWGAVAGVNISNLSWNQDLLSTDPSVGFQVGVTGELMFPGIGFGVDASLLYSQQGATLHMGDFPVWANDGIGNVRSYHHYLDIPIHLRFKYTNLNGIEGTIAPFVYAGPTFAIKLSHSHTDALEYPAMAFGLEGGIGAELFRRYQISVSYTWGMSYSVQTVKLDGYSAHNRNLAVKFAWMF